ncbi:MAG TPA: DUF1819 family protein [Candidatus Eremiobacteraeota bacterium]|nr:MAG: hypothetical protein BWY64_00490 [bacterium ADurb.Bin363]HPZ07489.1 DUF1819 family protein [Candidatus Eremiobacteraeota bacterium]
MKYNLSFIGASLFPNESIKLAKLYLDHKNWEKLQKIVLEENILQKNTLATTKREYRELKKRLENLPVPLLEYLVSSTHDMAKLTLIYAICKATHIIYDFIIEVIREKYLLFDYTLLDMDYEKFIRRKEEIELLSPVTDKTARKTKNMLLKILEQGGLLNNVKERQIQRPYVDEGLLKLIYRNDKHADKYFKIFLLSDTDIKNYRERFPNE